MGGEVNHQMEKLPLPSLFLTLPFKSINAMEKKKKKEVEARLERGPCDVPVVVLTRCDHT